jgi:hypothetical protein
MTMMSPQVSWLFFKARAKRLCRIIFMLAESEPE